MLSMSRRVDGARWVADSSLKFRVNGVFVNGKMTVSLPDVLPDPASKNFFNGDFNMDFDIDEIIDEIDEDNEDDDLGDLGDGDEEEEDDSVVATRLFQMGLGSPREPM